MATGDSQTIGNQFLYPLDDPATAFQNAMRRAGINPNASNPFTRRMQDAAQGARVAFLANMGSGVPGNQGTVPAGEPSANYGDWLTQSIQSGNLMSNLKHVGDNFSGALQQV